MVWLGGCFPAFSFDRELTTRVVRGSCADRRFRMVKTFAACTVPLFHRPMHVPPLQGSSKL